MLVGELKGEFQDTEYKRQKRDSPHSWHAELAGRADAGFLAAINRVGLGGAGRDL